MKGKNVRKLTVILFLLIVATSSAFAADATLPISGTVEASTTVSFSVASVADLVLDSATPITRTLGDLTETSNTTLGYTVVATSTNGVAANAATGILTGSVGSDTVTYTISYGGVGKAFVLGVATLNDTTAASGGPVTTAISIIYTPGSGVLTAATYSDTITFTITAK